MDESASMRTIDEARERYRPDGSIDLLFIAEAPPADPARFFYFEQVKRHDWLYLALMRALFDDARGRNVRQLREDKPDYLVRFCEAGYYLIDASDAPLPPRASRAVKRRQLQAAIEDLVRKACELAGPDTRIVLISRSVFDICAEPLKAAGLRVVNSEMIDFPSSGRQGEFARKLPRTLHEKEMSTCRP